MDADDEELTTLPPEHKRAFLRSFAHFMQSVKPTDIASEADRIDEDLRTEAEADIVMSDLDREPRRSVFHALSRLPNASRWLMGGTAALFVVGVLASWLLVSPPWQGPANIQDRVRVLFSTTKLGSLDQPAWTDDSQNTYAVGSSGNFVACPYHSTVAGECGKQHLSLGDSRGNFYEWDQSAGKIVKKLALKADTVSGNASFSWHWLYPGRYLVSDEHIPGLTDMYRLWDVARNTLLFTAYSSSSFPAGVEPFVLSSDGWLASFTQQQTVQVWNTHIAQQSITASFTLKSSYFAHLIALAWSPDGSQLATVSSDSTIQIWEPRTSNQPDQTLLTRQIFTESPFTAVRLVWSPDDQRLASDISSDAVHMPIQIWDLQTGHLLQSYSSEGIDPETLAWLDHGVEMLSGELGKNVQVWNTTTDQVITDLPWQIGATAFMPSIAQLQISSDRRWLILPQTYGVQIIDLQAGKALHTLPIKNNALLLGITLAPDRIHLAMVDQSGQVQLWNIQSGQLLTTYKLPVSFANWVEAFLTRPGAWSQPVDLAWSLNSQMLAVTYQGGGLVVLGILV